MRVSKWWHNFIQQWSLNSSAVGPYFYRFVSFCLTLSPISLLVYPFLPEGPEIHNCLVSNTQTCTLQPQSSFERKKTKQKHSREANWCLRYFLPSVQLNILPSATLGCLSPSEILKVVVNVIVSPDSVWTCWKNRSGMCVLLTSEMCRASVSVFVWMRMCVYVCVSVCVCGGGQIRSAVMVLCQIFFRPFNLCSCAILINLWNKRCSFFSQNEYWTVGGYFGCFSWQKQDQTNKMGDVWTWVCVLYVCLYEFRRTF